MPLIRRRLLALAVLGCAVLPARAHAEPQPLFGVPLAQLDGLEDPSGACFMTDGVLVISEARAHRLARFAPDGRRLADWGAEGLLSWPRDLACGEGRVALIDSGRGRIVVLDGEGRPIATAGEPGHASGQFHDARALALSGDDLLVADTGNDRVQHLSLESGEDGATSLIFRVRLGPFAQPSGVAFLEDGSVLVADTRGDRLSRLDPATLAPTDWGARGEAPGLFSRPAGLAVSGALIYSVDTENHRVQVFDSSGRWLGAWGRHAWLPHEGEGRLHYPERIAIDEARGVAVVCEPFEDRCQLFSRGEQPPDPARDRLGRNVDRSSHHGRRLSSSGRLIALTEMDGTSVSLMDLPRELPILIHRIGRPGRGHGLLSDAVAALVDGPTRVVVADAGARRLLFFEHDHDLEAPTRFSPRLSRLMRELDLTKVEIEPRIRPVALARPPGGELFVLDAAGSRVVVLDRNARILGQWGGFGEGPGLFRFPTDLAFTPDGERLLVVDSGNFRVQLFDRRGRHLASWGSRGRGDGEFLEAFGAVFGPEGGFFVSDRGTNRVQRFDAQGRFELSWGDSEGEAPPAERLGAGQLHRPSGVAWGEGNQLLVVDHGHHRGQIFTADGHFLRAFGARLYTRPTRGPQASGDEQGEQGDEP